MGGEGEKVGQMNQGSQTAAVVLLQRASPVYGRRYIGQHSQHSLNVHSRYLAILRPQFAPPHSPQPLHPLTPHASPIPSRTAAEWIREAGRHACVRAKPGHWVTVRLSEITPSGSVSRRNHNMIRTRWFLVVCRSSS